MLRKSFVALAAIVFLGFGPASSAAFEGAIAVRSNARIEGEAVTLADVAQLKGSAARYADLELARALAPAESRRLDGYAILQRLTSSGIDLEKVAYEIPVSVLITRAFQEVPAEQVHRAVASYLKQQGGELAEAVVKKVEYRRPVRLPLGQYSIGVATQAGSLRHGRLRVTLEFTGERERLKEIPATVELAAYAQAHFVRRTVRRGEIITASDLITRKREFSQLPVGAIADKEQAIGMKATRLLRPEVPLAVSDLAVPSVVKRGETVTLVVETEAMKIVTQGIAKEAGGLGQQIRVMNRKSGEEISGRVASASTVLVEF